MPVVNPSPLEIGIVGVIFGVLMVAAFQCIRICLEYDDVRRRSTAPPPPSSPASLGRNIHSRNQADASGSNGSFSMVQLLIATNYNSKECKEETCSVCLCEFNEGDGVTVLPGCDHVFHVLCIDKWLLSHTNCPLCRADTLRSLRDKAAARPNSCGSTPPDVQAP